MSTPENGLPQNVITYLPTPMNIQSSGAYAAGVTAVVVSGTIPASTTTGDWVDIQGHQVDTSVNGIWPITVLDNTTFTIPVASIGAGTATGTVNLLSTGTTMAVPSDGVDSEDAASVNGPFEALADRTAWLMLQTGAYKLAALQSVAFSNDSVGSSNFTAIAGAANTWGSVGVTGAPSGYPLIVPVVNGDILEVNAFGVAAPLFAAGLTQLRVGIGFETYVPGGAAGAYTKLVGVPLQCSSTNSPLQPFSMSACIFAGGSTIIRISFGFLWSGTGVASSPLQIYNDCGFVAKLWRATGKLQ